MTPKMSLALLMGRFLRLSFPFRTEVNLGNGHQMVVVIGIFVHHHKDVSTWLSIPAPTFSSCIETLSE